VLRERGVSLGGFSRPFGRFGVVLRDDVTGVIKRSKVGLAVRILCLGGFRKPADRVLCVLCAGANPDSAVFITTSNALSRFFGTFTPSYMLSA
jgi:hypothetical protein